MSANFEVLRDDLNQIRTIETPPLVPQSGEIVLRIEKFALTSNNITYGVAGDIIGYWQFFPAEGDWGRIPVWGIGEVTSSDHPNVEIGQRFYGYFPMSEALIVKPAKVTQRGFADASEHRAALPVVYNQYSLVSPENGFAPEFENHTMVYRPLFTTSFVLDDYFADNEFFAADTVILGSASSKTAFGLAFMLQRRGGKKVVGLTSQGNKDVLARVHHHLRDNLVNSCGVGITHWDALQGKDPASLPGAAPTMFFAPSQIVKRNKELGPEVYQQKIAAATAAFFALVDDWVSIQEAPLSNVEQVYRTVLNGPAPDIGYVDFSDCRQFLFADQLTHLPRLFA